MLQYHHAKGFGGSPQSSHLLEQPVHQMLDRGQPGFLDVSFFDDVAFGLVHASHDKLIAAATVVLSALCDSARARGLQVNFQAEKTEIMLGLKGKGVRKKRQELWMQADGTLPILLEHRVEHVRLVRSYKHLGSHLQCDAKPCKDTQLRIASARKAWGPLIRSLWTQKQVAQTNKNHIFRSLIAPRLLYNVHVWATLRDLDMHKLQAAFKEMIKPAIRGPMGGLDAHKFSCVEAAALASMLDPATQVRVDRLRYLARAVKYMPVMFWHIVDLNDAPAAWRALMVQDCLWLKKFHPQGDWPDPQATFVDWRMFVAQCGDWATRIRKAAKAALRFEQRQVTYKKWLLRMHEQWQSLGISFRKPKEDEKSDQVYSCDKCQRVFATKRGLYMHSAHAHEYRPKVRFFAGGSFCLSCGKEYHERVRLTAHLYYARDCVDKLEAIFPPLSLATVEELDQEDRDKAAESKAQGWSLKKAHLPACRVPHVSLPPQGSPEAQAIRNACSKGGQIVRPWHHVGGVLLSNCEEQEVAPTVTHEPIISGQAKGREQGAGGAFAASSLSVWYASVTIRCKVFVHLFSGHRRTHDLQHQIEHHQWVGTTQCFCLSIDLCLQGSAGDLLDRERIEWWRARILAGQVCGVGGGPPCETWSVARWMGGPPPVRDKRTPWGLPWISKKQHDQVEVGSGLLRVALELLLLCIYVGGCGFLEHPSFQGG